MCGGAIIYDYIPQRRGVSAADLWPDGAEGSEHHHGAHTAERGRHAAWIRMRALCFFVILLL
jgi:EREBP-like factor